MKRVVQWQLAQAMVEEAANMRKRLNNEPIGMPNKPPSAAESPKPDSIGPPAKISEKTAAAIAAEVADKLTASTRSRQIMTSVLSTFAAEAQNASLATSTYPSNSLSITTSDRRMISEKHLPISDTTTTAFVPVQQIVVSTPHQPQAVLVRQSPVQSQVSATQTQYMYPVSTQQYLQPSGGVMIGLPYTFSTLPPPPPPIPQAQVINLARSSSPLVQQKQSMALIQQPTAAAAPPPLLTMNQPMLINQQPPQYALQQSAPRGYRAPASPWHNILPYSDTMTGLFELSAR
ncbi:hypothetical protein B296_00032089 [Ensete ventricosum]|uniref:Uncharacterized protein n=1 Tax=Ensete ventricosum TaxID=4639 RepID=A0A426ZLQ1_ENSVE|nr:hypothetical protein B296_00032089 [Ensete ventricosum]